MASVLPEPKRIECNIAKKHGVVFVARRSSKNGLEVQEADNAACLEESHASAKLPDRRRTE